MTMTAALLLRRISLFQNNRQKNSKAGKLEASRLFAVFSELKFRGIDGSQSDFNYECDLGTARL